MPTKQDFIDAGRKAKALKIVQSLRKGRITGDEMAHANDAQWAQAAEAAGVKVPSDTTRALVLLMMGPLSMPPNARPQPLAPRPDPATIIEETRAVLAKHQKRGCGGCPTCTAFQAAIDRYDAEHSPQQVQPKVDRAAELYHAFDEF